MQPYLFPYIGYWQLINCVDTFVVFDDVNYIKKGYINRNYILINGQSKMFTLELIKASQNKPINTIEIGNSSEKLLKTIEMAYNKAPYFKIGFPILKEILTNEERNLSKFIIFSLNKISTYLQIETKIICSSDIKKNNSLKSQNKILDIINRLSATQYINAIGGVELYDKDAFKKKGIELNFLKTKTQKYTQFNNEFIPNLSIIDAMMFNSPKEVQSMLNEYQLI